MSPLRRISASLIVLVGATLAPAPAAHAKTVVDAVVGVDGFYSPGKSIAVRATIKADRLIKGTVEVKARDFNAENRTIVPIEVAGGATKEVVIVVPSNIQNPGQLNADLSVIVTNGADEIASVDVSAAARSDQELVGVFPQLLAEGKPPETSKLIVDAGTARLSPFLVADLASPGAAESYDMLAATSADLTALAPASMSELLAWLAKGGRLLVRNDAGLIPGVPTEWQPGANPRVGAGRGEVSVLSKGAWWESLEPTPTRSLLEDQGGGGLQMNGFPLANSLAADAGFTSARVNWLLGFLGAYVVIVGPVAYLVLKRLRRPGLLWAVVPALAGLFTVGAAVVGRGQQSGSRTGYATVMEYSPGGSWGVSTIGSLARGGSVQTKLPEGWRASGGTSPFFGGFNNGGASSGFTSTVTNTGVELRKATGVGQFETLTATGALKRTAPFAITATATDDRLVSGTVRNTSTVTMTDIAVFSGFGATKISQLAPGEEKAYTIAGVTIAPNFQNGPFDDARSAVWPDINAFQGNPTLDGPVNGSLWSNFLYDNGSNVYRTGRVVVAGWTRGEPSVLAVPANASGRTVLVQDVPVQPGATLTATAIRSEVVRAPGMFNGGPNAQIVASFTLPDPSNRSLRMFSTGGSQTMDLWVGSEWKSVTFDKDGTALPPGAVKNGRIYARYTPPNFGGTFQGVLFTEGTP